MKIIFLTVGIGIFLSTPCLSQNKPVYTDSCIRIEKSTICYHEKGDGNVPVIFISGLGEDHSNWQDVQDSISLETFTVSYDRSGLGQSPYHNEKKDLLSMAIEFKHLLDSLRVHTPFILVGHSLGCEIAKEYAALYPEKVKAIIFIDPGYNEETLKHRVGDSIWHEREKALKMYMPELSPAQKEEFRLLNSSVAMADTTLISTNISVVLFTATKVNPQFPASRVELAVKEESHEHWLHSMPQAVHIYVPESRHYIQNENPSVVIKAIRKMLE